MYYIYVHVNKNFMYRIEDLPFPHSWVQKEINKSDLWVKVTSETRGCPVAAPRSLPTEKSRVKGKGWAEN